MKTLKSILFSIAILAVATVANAKSTHPGKPLLTQDYVINTYVAAITQGNLNDFNRVLEDDVTFNVEMPNGVKSYQKDDELASLKDNEGVKEDCTTTTSKIKENAESTIYEVDMKYADHTRVDMVTLIQNGDNWRIGNVVTSFK